MSANTCGRCDRPIVDGEVMEAALIHPYECRPIEPVCVLCHEPIKPSASDPASHVGCCIGDDLNCCSAASTVGVPPEHVRGCPLFTHPTQRKPGHPTDCRCSALEAGGRVGGPQPFTPEPGETFIRADGTSFTPNPRRPQ